MVLVATTPAFETKFVMDETPTLSNPNPKIALSVLYLAAAVACLAVPTPAVSVETTPVFETLFVMETYASEELRP